VKKDRARLSVKLLGGFETRLTTGATVTLPTRKAQALLAYLAVRPGQAHPRDKLAALLWGDRADAQARDSLRHTLVQLRKIFSERSPGLTAEGRALVLEPAAVDVDVVRFETLAGATSTGDLAQAAEIYGGDFLEGFLLNEPAFETWLVGERERLRELALGSLRRLLEQQARAGASEGGIRTALRLVALDATQEVAHRALMRLYVQQGRRAAALRQYQTCVAVLRRELGTEPEVETRQLYQEIVRRRDEPARARATPAKSTTVSADPPRRVAIGTETDPSETPLTGRATELATLANAFDEARGGGDA
jgi:DNA-binding SARP family transcriptional activator